MKVSTIVWWFLGEIGWFNKANPQEGTGKSLFYAASSRDNCHWNWSCSQQLTLDVQYVPMDVSDVEPLTPTHQLCGKRITTLPHPYEDSPDGTDYLDDLSMRRQLDNHSRILQNFQAWWRKEYVPSSREFHKAAGHNKPQIKVGDIVLIHDDKPWLNWKLALIEEMIEGNDGVVSAANVRTSSHTISRPIVKLRSPIHKWSPIHKRSHLIKMRQRLILLHHFHH